METGLSDGEAEHLLSFRARDLLRRFSGGFSPEELVEVAGGDSDEIELGLSLGGSFSSQFRQSSGLVRSSSIPAVLPCELKPMLAPLARTCSLPSEAEEELRRRKDLQSLKRMEAKRKREEKRSSKRAEERSDEDTESESAAKMRRFLLENRNSLIPGVVPAGLPRWIAGASVRPSSSAKSSSPASQASVASHGSSSTGGSELESRQRQGIDVAGFSSIGVASSLPMKNLSFGVEVNEGFLKKNGGKAIVELGKNMMEEMPCVSTRGEGPNGKKIEGFLYRYKKGEEVRIVCVCHGSFFTPAEFVKHGGGGDVDHPLRHIVVNPGPAAFL